MADQIGVREAAARRTAESLVQAAATEFVDQGVQAPVRDIAARAGVGVGTVYRHFPSRADLVVAVYRHQVDECAALAPALLASEVSPGEALATWVGAFVDFLVTKHGLGAALQSEDASMHGLHALMLDTLVPACQSLVDAGVASGEIDADVEAYTLMRAIGNLSIVGPGYGRAAAMEMVSRLLVGCRPHS